MTDLNRRGLLAAGAATAIAAAGCLEAVTGQQDSLVDDHHTVLQVRIDGEGPTQPIQLTVESDDFEFAHQLHPDDYLSTSAGDVPQPVDISAEYDDEVEVEVEQEIDGVALAIDIEQDVWQRTTVDVDLSVDEQTITLDGTVDVRLPDSSTEVALADDRERDEWDYDIEVDVEDGGRELEVELEIDQDD